MKVNDITGKTFGRLTILNRVPSTRKGAARWLASCQCGNTCEVNGIDVRAGKVMSCGCLQRTDLTGKHFGRLTAIKPAETLPDGKTRWLCMCSCGQETVVRTVSLNNGLTRSCGCLHRDTMKRLWKQRVRRAGRG